MSNVSKIIRDIVAEMPIATVFTYDALGEIAKTDRQAVAKALSRLVKRGDLAQLSKGKFYRPEISKYGELPLTEDEQIRSALRGGYISGAEAFNRLGISTQIPAEIVIAAPGLSYRTKVGNIKIRYVKSQVDVPIDKPEMAMILDALKQVNNIQDASPMKVIKVVKKRIAGFSVQDLELLTQLGLSYPPRVRALLGAILETLGFTNQSSALKNSLNALTKYRIEGGELLSNLKSWGFR